MCCENALVFCQADCPLVTLTLLFLCMIKAWFPCILRGQPWAASCSSPSLNHGTCCVSCYVQMYILHVDEDLMFSLICIMLSLLNLLAASLQMLHPCTACFTKLSDVSRYTSTSQQTARTHVFTFLGSDNDLIYFLLTIVGRKCGFGIAVFRHPAYQHYHRPNVGMSTASNSLEPRFLCLRSNLISFTVKRWQGVLWFGSHRLYSLLNNTAICQSSYICIMIYAKLEFL
jgi:hypothetical protein